MAARLDPFQFYNHYPSYGERASVYIGDYLSEEQRQAAGDLAEAFEDPDRPVASTAVLIPVAAHQDGKHIFHTMGEYAKQGNAEPFTVFLYLNNPIGCIDSEQVSFASSEVERAKKAYPDLDIRSATGMHYESTIGTIRGDLWHGALLLAYHENQLSNDIVGINNDIDTTMVSPHYLSRIQKHYDRQAKRAAQIGAVGAAAMPVSTRVTHAVSPDHPNVGKVTTWIDNSYFQSPGHGTYEAGMVIPFSYYMMMAGFDQEAATHETSFVDYRHAKRVVGAQLYTSPRRYIERLVEHDSSEIWTPGTFGSRDTCRDSLPPDISMERAEDLITERLDSDISELWLPGSILPLLKKLDMQISMGSSGEAFLQHMYDVCENRTQVQLSKAERLLRRVVGSEVLADMVQTSYSPKQYVKELMLADFLEHR